MSKTDSVEIADRQRDLVRSIVEGERGFHQLPGELDPVQAATIRRQALEQLCQVDLGRIGRFSVDAARVSEQHCENFLGTTEIPLGVVGPLRISGDYVDEEVYVPLATTEGALIASVNRGCMALRHAGGAVVRVEDVGMTRAPVFRTSGVVESRRLLQWVDEHRDEMHEAVAATSRYLRLLDVKPFSLGTSVYLRFRFATGDAMGMNMATIACDRIVRELIEPATGVSCIALSGNFCADKKPSAVNFLEGRGKRIHAEVVLDTATLARLKTDARSLAEVQYRKNLLGSIVARSPAFNAHYANVVAAFFVATGQDVAQVVEGAIGVTCVEERDDGCIYASVFVPNLPLATIGGGTALGTQTEALRLLRAIPDSARPGAATMRVAEILGATILAGELSLLAAFTSQDLARAHERLGRSKQVSGP